MRQLIILIFASILVSNLVACGPSQAELEKQRQLDSIRVADSLKAVQYEKDSLEAMEFAFDLVSTLKKKVLSEKESILAEHSGLQSIDNINDKTINFIINESGGNMIEYGYSERLRHDYTEMCINEWYVNSIESANRAEDKKLLAEEYNELSPIIKTLSDINSDASFLSCYGGSGASIEGTIASQQVYQTWLDNLKKEPRPTQRMTEDEVSAFIKSLQKSWGGMYRQVNEFCDDEDFLKQYDKEVKAKIAHVKELVEQKPPYKWLSEIK